MQSISSVLDQRRAGLLLHITSLPDSVGNGDMGPAAYRFIEFLADCGVSVWQTLPLGPTHSDGSPYQCLSSHAGNPMLISLEWLVDRGWLTLPAAPERWPSVAEYRMHALKLAYDGFQQFASEDEQRDYHDFVHNHKEWLNCYAFYMALRHRFDGKPWYEWPEPLRDRRPAALTAVKTSLKGRIEQVHFEQYIFFRQWSELRVFAHQHGVLLFGDLPIFVAGDSADVWAGRDYFQLDETGHPRVVAGVPPDYFSETGQLWGNPHYDWKKMQSDNFKWWIKRVESQLELFDWVRIDHFRGFEAYWEIPADAETAIDGRWVKAPGEALLQAIYDKFGTLPLVAEDLGIITPEVEALRDQFNLPGMKILQFAFDGGPENAYLPHNNKPNSVVYSGTHDNDTTLSWFESLSGDQQYYIYDYLGQPSAAMPWPIIQSVFRSSARLAIIPMQDVLGLGYGHRMNTPGTVGGNWQWRFSWDQLNEEHIGRLKHQVALYGRVVKKD